MILRLRDKYGRFLVLLVALVAYLVLYPLLEHTDSRVILLVLTLGIPVAGVYAVSARRRDLIIATVLALPLVADYLTPNVQWPLVLSIGFPLLLPGDWSGLPGARSTEGVKFRDQIRYVLGFDWQLWCKTLNPEKTFFTSFQFAHYHILNKGSLHLLNAPYFYNKNFKISFRLPQKKSK